MKRAFGIFFTQKEHFKRVPSNVFKNARKMLRALSFIWIGFLFVLISCEKEENATGNVEIESTNHSECKNLKARTIGDDEVLYITAVGAGSYTIKHENLVLNCCLDEGIAVAVEQKGDTIILNEWEKKAGMCDCVCPYDVETTIGGIEQGTYVFRVLTAGWERGSIELIFNENMDETIPFSELD